MQAESRNNPLRAVDTKSNGQQNNLLGQSDPIMTQKECMRAIYPHSHNHGFFEEFFFERARDDPAICKKLYPE